MQTRTKTTKETPMDPRKFRTTSGEEDRAAQIRRAQAMRAEGRSIFEIATTLGRSKEWLREYAGLR